MRAAALFLIRLYRRLVSPRKGFACAYRVHTGRRSCSCCAERAIRRFGVWRGIAILRRRLYLCGVAHRRCAVIQRPLDAWSAQRGECDCDFGAFDSCDVWPTPADDVAGGVGSSCGCGPCDLVPGRSKKAKASTADESRVHLPRRSRAR